MAVSYFLVTFLLAQVVAQATSAAHDDSIITNASSSSSNDNISNEINQLDLVFLIDATGSMSSYIEAVKTSVHSIVDRVKSTQHVDVRVAMIGYRDHEDEWVTKGSGFMSDRDEMVANIAQLRADGGGDTPEAITAGLAELLTLQFRDSATRIVILIGDAPDHGLGEPSDEIHRQGDPYGRDPIVIAHELAARGCVIYSVGCEPSLSQSRYGRDFFMTLAEITHGRYLPLSSATLLADVVVGGASEQIGLERLQEHIEKATQDIQHEYAQEHPDSSPLDDETIVPLVAERLRAEGTKIQRLNVDNLYTGYDTTNVKLMASSASLSAARTSMTNIPQPKPAAGSDSSSFSSFSYASPLSARSHHSILPTSAGPRTTLHSTDSSDSFESTESLSTMASPQSVSISDDLVSDDQILRAYQQIKTRKS